MVSHTNSITTINLGKSCLSNRTQFRLIVKYYCKTLSALSIKSRIGPVLPCGLGAWTLAQNNERQALERSALKHLYKGVALSHEP